MESKPMLDNFHFLKHGGNKVNICIPWFDGSQNHRNAWPKGSKKSQNWFSPSTGALKTSKICVKKINPKPLVLC